MKKSPKIFEESLEKTYNNVIERPKLDHVASAFLDFWESQGVTFVDADTQKEYKKGTVRVIKAKSKSLKDC